MICENCRTAGDMNWLINTKTVPLSIHATLEGRIELNHSNCLGRGQCDCQHKVGNHLTDFE